MTQKREEIIRTAATLIETNGYGNTKLSDILQASNAGKGQFYYYFSSKRDLGLAVIDYFFESFNRNLLENILGSQKNPEAKLNEMLTWIVTFHQAKHAKCGCVFGNLALEMSGHDEAFRAKVNAVFNRWADRIQRVLRDMCASPVDDMEVQKLSQSIVAMIEGGILLMKNNQNIEPLEDIASRIKCLVASFAKQYSASAAV